MFSMKIGTKKEKSKPQKIEFNNNANPKPNAVSNVFSNLNDNETCSQSLSNRQLINRQAKNKKNKREINKMVKKNPTIFEYDELYDSFQEKRNEAFREKEREKTLRPVRYIDKIQKESQRRQVRHDAAHEKLLLKERKETDHLFENKQKYITRAYKDKLKEIEQQRAKDKIQSKNEKTIDNDPQMFGFFNSYLQNKTNGKDRNKKEKMSSVSRSRSRSRSRDRNTNTNNIEDKNKLNEEQRYHIQRHQMELSKTTFSEDKQKELEQIAMKQCAKRTTSSDLKSLRERYLKRKSLNKT